ncbi:unnamed protein product [Effrenium voratum]|nr:unnamed protein product [Effrenium voratum]
MAEVEVHGEEALPEVWALHDAVFGASAQAEAAKWRQRMAEGRGFHLVVRQDGRVVSFLTAYESNKEARTTPVDHGDCLHLWMAGTLPAFEGRGFMSALFAAALDVAKTRSLRQVTLNTFPERFPAMYKLATGRWGMVEVKYIPLGSGERLPSFERKIPTQEARKVLKRADVSWLAWPGMAMFALPAFLGAKRARERTAKAGGRKTNRMQRKDAMEPRDVHRNLYLPPLQKQVAPKVAIVTGATGRLGAAVAKGLAEHFTRIILVGRDERRGNAVVAELADAGVEADFQAVDLADQSKVHRFCSALGDQPIHSLVLLAGVTAEPTREETPDGLELHLGLNYLSRFHMVTQLLENLKRGGSADEPARVLLCGSSRHRGEPLLGFAGLGAPLPLGLGAFEDLQLAEPGAYRPWKAFGQAALCNVMFAYELQKRLRAEDAAVAVSCFDPGAMTTAWDLYRQEENRWRATGMSSWEKEVMSYFTRLVEEPEAAAAIAVKLATGAEGAMPCRKPQVGFPNYWEQGQPALSKFPVPWNWSNSYDEGSWVKLWEVSQELLRPQAVGESARDARAATFGTDGASGLREFLLGQAVTA